VPKLISISGLLQIELQVALIRTLESGRQAAIGAKTTAYEKRLGVKGVEIGVREIIIGFQSLDRTFSKVQRRNAIYVLYQCIDVEISSRGGVHRNTSLKPWFYVCM
jgi:hypothetical protein